ncbi:FMN reductase [Pseudolysinimonas sp.]
MTIRIVGVSGSLTAPSRTTALVDAVVSRLAARLETEAPVTTRTIELAGLLPDLFAGRSRADLGAGAEDALVAVEQADVVVAGSPAYRAAYTGIFKHFFDYVGQYALVDKPVVLTATGGSDRHALLVEHQMRPLFGFFQALTLPLGIYGNEGDFADYRVSSEELRERIDLSIGRAAPLLSYQLRSSGRLAELPTAG